MRVILTENRFTFRDHALFPAELIVRLVLLARRLERFDVLRIGEIGTFLRRALLGIGDRTFVVAARSPGSAGARSMNMTR